jgi:acyl-CoA reductase-like NAD-dependent aldehyde dehydrogenase
MQAVNALEFPCCHDHEEGWSGIGGRVHGGPEAEQPNPPTAAALSVLAKRAGIQRGVFKVVTARGGMGEEMCPNATVKKVLLMGSTPVSKLMMKLISNTVK